MKNDIRYIVCFYWIGERWQEEVSDIDKVTDDTSFRNHLRRVGIVQRRLIEVYIDNLYQGVVKYADRAFKFVCFTNEKVNVNPNIEIRELPMYSTRGVLPRMYMFSEDAGLFGHQVLSLDLDVIIVRSLSDILSYDGLFCTRESWSKTEFGLPDGDVMSFRAGPETEAMFWKPFISDVAEAERITQGRERRWIRHCTKNKCDLFKDITPGQIVSLKHHVHRQDHLPNKLVRIVSCHGFPRPHQFSSPWKDENWPMENLQPVV